MDGRDGLMTLQNLLRLLEYNGDLRTEVEFKVACSSAFAVLSNCSAKSLMQRRFDRTLDDEKS
jgi:hypothetical protein